MKSEAVLCLLWVVSCVLVEGQNAKVGPRSDMDVVEFLDTLGYLDNGDPQADIKEKVKRAIWDYQSFHRLPASGELDKETTEMMKRQRCMAPDVIKRHLKDEDAPEEFRLADPLLNSPLYKKKLMTYRIYKYPANMAQRGLNRGAIRRMIRDIFNMWSSVIPVNFRETSGTPDFDIGFEPRRHGDRDFDGPGGKLAHADTPSYEDKTSFLHFDDEEPWVMSGEGRTLPRTAAHEIGHLLGLVHSQEPDSLMRSWTYGNEQTYELSEDDIRGIQQIYGFRPGGPHPTGVFIPFADRTTIAPPPTTPRRRPTRAPTTTPRPVPTRPMTQPWCSVTFDAIEQVHNNKIYGFHQSRVYEITQNDPIVHGLRSLYREAPSSVGAVVYDPISGKTIMFKGSQWWQFTGFNLDQGFPKPVPPGFENIDAACMQPFRNDGTGMVTVFKGPKHSFFIPDYGTEQRWGRRINKGYLLEEGDEPTAIFRDRSTDHVVIFQGREYWESTDKIGRILKTRKPTDMRPKWLNCGRPI